jgi:hypothetical protein
MYEYITPRTTLFIYTIYPCGQHSWTHTVNNTSYVITSRTIRCLQKSPNCSSYSWQQYQCRDPYWFCVCLNPCYLLRAWLCLFTTPCVEPAARKSASLSSSVGEDQLYKRATPAHKFSPQHREWSSHLKGRTFTINNRQNSSLRTTECRWFFGGRSIVEAAGFFKEDKLETNRLKTA